MIHIEVHAHVGFKPWLARITGLDSKLGLVRTFVPAEREGSRTGKAADLSWDLHAPGLYEVGGSKKSDEFFVVWIKEDEGIVRTIVSPARAEAIAKLLASGVPIEEARLATKPPVPPARGL